MISLETFDNFDQVFDLFLEQSVLCTYEGFSDFLKLDWLDYILTNQHASGCFPSTIPTNQSTENSIQKRETNELKDGCADHTTGLGAAILALYLDYLIRDDYYNNPDGFDNGIN